MTNVSASCRRTILAATSTPGTYWDGVAMETTYATTSACSCPADDGGRHHTATLLHDRRHGGCVEARSGERRSDAAALAAVTVTAGAVLGEDGLATHHVARERAARRRGRREHRGLGEDERHHDDGAAGQNRAPPAPHQKPNLTVVKYQKLDVSHSSRSIDASVRPAVGSAQPGSE